MSALPTPTITAFLVDRVNIVISGLQVPNASGYQVRWGTLSGYGRQDTVQPDNDGNYTLSDLRCRTTYYIAARALGDDETYTNSDWSTEIVVVTGQVVDSGLAVPNVSLAAVTTTTASFSPLSPGLSYRYQLAIDPLILPTVNPSIAAGGGFVLQGLAPNTTYYIRFCSTAAHSRCSLWADTITFTTATPTATATVLNANDTGAGSLRQVMTDAAEGTLITFDPSLSGQTINIGSTLTNTKSLVIDGSNLSTPITLDLSTNAGRYIVGANLEWRGVIIKNGVLSANARTINGGSFTDCVFTDQKNTYTVSTLYNARFTRCRFAGFNGTNSGFFADGCTFYDCVIQGCSGALIQNSTTVNTIFTANNALTRRGFNGGTIYNSTLYDNTGSAAGSGAYGSTLIQCDVVQNTNTAAASGTSLIGILNGTTLRDCRVENNQMTVNDLPCVGGSATTMCYDSVFRNNKSATNCGVCRGSYYRCIIEEDDLEDPITYSNPIFYSCLLKGKVVNGTLYCCTALNFAATNGRVWNSLLGPGATSPILGSNNYTWADPDAVFIDAANGDYRLTANSPAINAGLNSYAQTDTDLAGNTRINGETVDLGCYEFVPYQLNPPTYSLNILPGGQATISYTLPANSSGFCLQYDSTADFTNPTEITSDTSTFDLAGLSGSIFIRTKAIGISGKTLDSDWTPTDDIYVDTIAPVVLVDSTPITMTYGESVNFLDGVSVTDDSPGQISIHYTVYDYQGQAVEIDGQTTDIPSARITKGNYRLVITATDALQNTGTAERDLSILPPKLTTPTITLKSISGNTATISGLLDSAASGWLLSVDGQESTVVPNQGGQLQITLADGTHLVKAKAKGDYIVPDPPEQPTGDYRDSDYSNTLTIVVGGETPTGTPTISQQSITDHTLTLSVDGLGSGVGYVEVLISQYPNFAKPILITKLPAATITISGLQASTVYFIKLRGVYQDAVTDYSPWVCVETLTLQATSPADKLIYIRSRIQLLRDYLAELGNLSSISIDGISETQVDRAQIRAELAELEQEEQRLMNGGSRIYTMDVRRVI